MRLDLWAKTVAAIAITASVTCIPLIENYFVERGAIASEERGAIASEKEGDAPMAAPAPKNSQDETDPSAAAIQRIARLLSSPEGQVRVEPSRWQDLEEFHQLLWKSLALDPIPNVSPDETASEAMTRELDTRLSAMIASPVVARLGAKEEFEEYASACQDLIELRKRRLYREARRIVRSGTLDRLYQAVVARIRKGSPDSGQQLGISMTIPADLEAQLRAALGELRRPPQSGDRAVAPGAVTRSQPISRHRATHVGALVLANILWLLASIIAFLTGRAVGRRSQLGGTGSSAGVENAGSAGAPTGIAAQSAAVVRVGNLVGNLDYSQWMKRYEAALATKKQNEAKDQDLIKKLNHFSWSFSQFFIQYHLEPPTADLERFKKELRAQSDGLKELINMSKEAVARGDRNYHEILEQLLELCDSIEQPGRSRQKTALAA